jgi:ribonuclease HI
MIKIYTDGACSGNPGPGGWGVVIIDANDNKREMSGFSAYTTNNRMELTAAIEPLKEMFGEKEIEIYSDSQYLIDAFNKNWLRSWKRNGWRKGNGEAVLNLDLWKLLDSLIQNKTVKWIKVKGHSDNEYNNRCDKLATTAIKRGLA